MYEWLLWTGVIAFGLMLIYYVFHFDWIIVLSTLLVGLGAMIWIRFVRFPPYFRAYERQLAKQRYFSRERFTAPGDDHPLPLLAAPAAPLTVRRGPVARDAEGDRCRSRSAASAWATGVPTGRPARPGSRARSSRAGRRGSSPSSRSAGGRGSRRTRTRTGPTSS